MQCLTKRTAWKIPGVTWLIIKMSPDQKSTIYQVSQEIQGRLTKKLSQDYSRTESRFSGAPSRLDDFLLNPLSHGHSGIVPETFRNTLRTNTGTKEDDSQSDLLPESDISQSQTTNSGPDDTDNFVTGVQDENTYCFPSTSSGDQMETRSNSQPQQ